MISSIRKTILILAANPIDTPALRLEQEIREIDEGLRRARCRDDFHLEYKLAARPVDAQRAMLDTAPNIVHFSGHGDLDGIAFESDAGTAQLVNSNALASLFELFSDSVECVLLNSCYSERQAVAISSHIEYVIGMKKEIGDAAATRFSVGFYDALGAGRDVEFAFGLGCASIQLSGLAENLTPVLLRNGRIVKKKYSSC